jgi:hypothetical protein
MGRAPGAILDPEMNDLWNGKHIWKCNKIDGTRISDSIELSFQV